VIRPDALTVPFLVDQDGLEECDAWELRSCLSHALTPLPGDRWILWLTGLGAEWAKQSIGLTPVGNLDEVLERKPKRRGVRDALQD
jgi:hypothetical protein